MLQSAWRWQDRLPDAGRDYWSRADLHRPQTGAGIAAVVSAGDDIREKLRANARLMLTCGCCEVFEPGGAGVYLCVEHYLDGEDLPVGLDLLHRARMAVLEH